MPKIAIVKATTDATVYIFIQDSSATDGSGLTGLVYNSAGLVCYYVRPLANAAALSLATQTVTGAHSDGGFVEVSSANMPGIYRLDLSDAILATGVDSVVVSLKGATDMAPVNLEIQLTDFDLNDASPLVTLASETHTGAIIPTVTTLTGHTAQTGDNYARLGAPAGASMSADISEIEGQTDDIGVAGAGLTAVPWNAAWDAQVESEVTDALNAYDPPTNAEMVARTVLSASYFDPAVDTVATVTDVTNDVGVGTNNDKAGYSLSAAGVQAIWDALTSALVAVGSIGKLLVDNIDATISSRSSSAEVAALNNLSAANVATELATYDSPTNAEMEARTLVAASYGTAANQANIETDTQDIQGRLPVALVGGAMNSDISAIQASAITAASVATDAIGAAELAADAVAEIQSGLATDTNQTTILARIGSFTGSGFNTVLGFFQAALRSDATTPSDLGGTYDDGTDSLQALRDRGDAAWITGGGGSDPALLQNTTIATLASQVSFTLTAGPPDDNAINGATAVVTDQSDGTQKAVGTILDYAGSTKTVTLQSDPAIFIMAVGDTIDIIATDKLAISYTTARASYLDNLNGHTPQTGDSFARLGAPAGASVSVDVADIPTNAEMEARTLIAASYFDPAADAVATVTDVTNDVGVTQAGADKVWDTTVRTLSAFGFTVTVGTNNDKVGYSLSSAGIQAIWDVLTSALVQAGSIGKLIIDSLDAAITSRSSHSASDVTGGTQVATAESNVRGGSDTLATLSAQLDTAQADLDNPNQYKADVSALALEATVAALNDLSFADIFTTQMTESYAADGVAPTPAQALFLIMQSIGEVAVTGTTITVMMLDGSTVAATYSTDNAIEPTIRTRVT